MTGGADSAPAPQQPPQLGAPPPPQIQPTKSAAEQAAKQAVEVAKKQTLYNNSGPIVKQEAGKNAPIGIIISHPITNYLSTHDQLWARITKYMITKYLL